MKLLEPTQYKFIEDALFNYNKLADSSVIMIAIKRALKYFEGTQHETMMREFYFKAKLTKEKFRAITFFRSVCRDFLAVEESNGYVIRREIIYKIAMECLALDAFSTETVIEEYYEDGFIRIS